MVLYRFLRSVQKSHDPTSAPYGGTFSRREKALRPHIRRGLDGEGFELVPRPFLPKLLSLKTLVNSRKRLEFKLLAVGYRTVPCLRNGTFSVASNRPLS